LWSGRVGILAFLIWFDLLVGLLLRRLGLTSWGGLLVPLAGSGSLSKIFSSCHFFSERVPLCIFWWLLLGSRGLARKRSEKLIFRDSLLTRAPAKCVIEIVDVAAGNLERTLDLEPSLEKMSGDVALSPIIQLAPKTSSCFG